MEIKPVVPWVGDRDFEKQNPIFGKIESVQEGANKWGKPEVQLNLDIEGQKRCVSLFGDNRNECIAKFGTDSEKWVGKSVQIALLTDPRDGKRSKTIRGM